MIDLRRGHWFLAFSLALGVHLAVFVFSLGQPGREPVYRGGSFYHEKDPSTRSGSRVFVKLDNAGASTGDNVGNPVKREEERLTDSNEVPSQGPLIDPDAREDSSNKVAVAVEPRAANKKDNAPKAEPEFKDVGKEVKPKADTKDPANELEAKPTPMSKSKPPKPLPELESLTRRLSVQGPVAAVDENKAESETPPAAKPETLKLRTGGGAGEATITKAMTPFSEPGRAGTASSDKYGDVRKLNYEDRVLLWIKAHGGYPQQALMFNLEDTVTVHFAIGPNGKILYHYLTKSSQYHLLNKAIERMMERSSPVPPFPPEIRRDKMTFTVTVHFDPYFES